MLYRLVSSVSVMKVTLVLFALFSFSQAQPEQDQSILDRLHDYGIHNASDFADFLTRVKRATSSSGGVSKSGDFFRVFTLAYKRVYGRARKMASLGTIDDMPTEILRGARSYRPNIEDPALKDLTMRRVRSQKNKRGPGRGRAANDYASKVKRSIRGVRYKEGLRKQDVAGCGPPICTIIDMRIKTFKSFCHLVEYANDQGLHRRIFEIQKGSCETAIKYPKGKWNIFPWLRKRVSNCDACQNDKVCGQKICLNENGHAKTFENVCQVTKYLRKKRQIKLVSIAMGECKALFSNCQYTEWFDLDDPCGEGEKESVGQVFNYLSGLNDKNVHRSCALDHVHYPVEIVTTQGQTEVKNSRYQKLPHELICQNDKSLPDEFKPKKPYYWQANNVTCRDWKLRFCCDNLWGSPALYSLISSKAEGDVPKQVSDTDVYVDPPTRKTLFEDCKWGEYMSIQKTRESDIDPIFLHGDREKTCGMEKGRAMYIDARTVKDNIPWDQTGDVFNKVSPHYGVYCERLNNGKECQDYKYRLCCSKEEKKVYGPWGKWSGCEGDCGPNNAFLTRTRKCLQSRPNCRKINGKMVVEDKKPCTIQCKEDRKWLEWGQWSACSATCGRGKRHRERFCLAGNSESQECPKSKEMQGGGCQEAKCHVYELSPWGQWSACSASCGHATRSRSRSCQDTAYGVENVDHGLCSENKELFVQQRVCDKIKPCPRDGGLTEWEPWSACDANCGKGNQTSQRFCLKPAPAFGGKNCRGDLERRRVCDSGKPCPIHCVLSPWGEWSSCSQTCVTSNDVSLTEKTRYRHVAQEGSHGGVQCPLNLNQIKPCDLCKDDKKAAEGCIPRCPIDCKLGEWNDWNLGSCRCPGSKNPGTKFRWREIQFLERYGGQTCKDRNGHSFPKGQSIEQESANCNRFEQRSMCPSAVRPAVTPWTEWSTCQVNCHHDGGKRYGHQTRRRICHQPEKCGNKKMEQKRKCRSACQEKDHPVEYTEWSQCSVTCGLGKQTRKPVHCLEMNEKRRRARGGNPKLSCKEQERPCDMGECDEFEQPELIVTLPEDRRDMQERSDKSKKDEF